MDAVLIAYATKSGSTAELAEVIAEVLRKEGLAADVRPAKEVRSIAAYQGIVLAAALYMGRLHKEARRFLQAQRADLARMPVALFVPGPVENREKDFAGARQQLEKELSRYPWLAPVAQHVVGGVFDPSKLGFPGKLVPFLRKLPASDARDWPEIRSLAAKVAAKLHGAALVSG